MKLSNPTWIVAGLFTLLACAQYLKIHQLGAELSRSKEMNHQLTRELDERSFAGIELQRRIEDLEKNLLIVSLDSSITLDDGTASITTNSDQEDRKTKRPTDDDSLIEPNFQSETLDLLAYRETILAGQEYDFQSRIIGEYGDFLDSINMNEAEKQNILAEINFNRELYIDAIRSNSTAGPTDLSRDGKIRSTGRKYSSLDIMKRNLDEQQYLEFRQSQAQLHPELARFLEIDEMVKTLSLEEIAKKLEKQ